jgi:hypothetical protein
VANTNHQSDSVRADRDRTPQTEYDVLERAISHRGRIHKDEATDVDRAFVKLRARDRA